MSEPLVEVRRGGLTESVHHGLRVVLGPGGAVLESRGDVGAAMYPRSAVKPFQAAAMLAAGLDLRGPALALAASSHSGEPRHVETARAILAAAGLDEDALGNVADLPLSSSAAAAWLRAEGDPDRIHMNCSGKHAAMLATCVANGWGIEDYLDPSHPLQVAVAAGIAAAVGEPLTAQTVDGCGAPLYAMSLLGLARGFGAMAADDAQTPSGRVAAAMRSHPELVGGEGRDVTALLRALPGCVAKDGAEGVYAVGLPDGSAVAVKLADGGVRGRLPALLAGLALLGHHPDVPVPPVLGGGRPVGEVVAV